MEEYHEEEDFVLYNCGGQGSGSSGGKSRSSKAHRRKSRRRKSRGGQDETLGKDFIMPETNYNYIPKSPQMTSQPRRLGRQISDQRGHLEGMVKPRPTHWADRMAGKLGF